MTHLIEGQWVAYCEGGPFDGHEGPLADLPEYVEVEECPACKEVVYWMPGEAPGKGEVYKLIDKKDWRAKYIYFDLMDDRLLVVGGVSVA